MSLSKLWKTVKDREKPGMLQFMELQRVRHDLVTENSMLLYKQEITRIFESSEIHMCFIGWELSSMKFWRVITLQYCIDFAIHQHESTMGVHVFPHPEAPSRLPPCTIPLGHPSAPAPSILYPALNLDWWFVSYMILYMFQCNSPFKLKCSWFGLPW